MDIINNAVLNGQPLLNEASRNLKLPDGSNADFSFIAFPYDFAANDKRLNMTQSLIAMSPTTRRRTIIDTYEKECKALGGVLDRVLSRGFEPADSVLVPMPITETQPDSYSEEVVRSFIVNWIKICSIYYYFFF